MKSFDRSLLGLALLLILGPFRWPLYIDPYWKKAYTKVHSFIDKRVQQALVKQNNSEEVTRPDRNNYVLLEEMAKITQDPYRLRMQILNVFFPARDTAAIGFSDVMFELARHPDEWARLRKEVDGIHPGQDLSFEFLRSLDITKSIIQESLRLHPAASRIGRTALRDTVLPKGGGPSGESSIFVPHGTVIEMDLYTVQRNEQFWGGDANEFKPSRWLRKGRPLWEAKWQYEPFLGGVRMCPAQNQVLIQLAYLLVRFTQEVRTLENRDEVHEYVEKITMTVESKHGVKVALSPVVKT
jgi:cytochrome P450